MQNLIKALSTRLGLIIPFGIAFLLIGLHGIYWVIVSSQIDTRAHDWIAVQEQAGYSAGYDNLSVGGYPFRFTLRADNPILTAPGNEGGWTATINRLEASAQFYNLNHWILTFGTDAMLDMPSQAGETERYRLTNETARFSVVLSNGQTSRIGAELNQLAIEALSGQSPLVQSIGSGRLNGFVTDQDVFRLRFQIEDAGINPDRIPQSVIDEFGTTADFVRVQSNFTQWSALATAQPWTWREADGQLNVEMAQLVWGAADLQGSGAIGLDRELLPEGRLSLVVTDPNTLISALVDSELVYSEQGEALRLFALMAPRRESGIALPFRLQDGGLFLGPARLGAFAPRDDESQAEPSEP
jgi:hypothetical protein